MHASNSCYSVMCKRHKPQLAMLPTLVVANDSTILLTIMFVQGDNLVAERQNNCKLLHQCLIVMLLQLKR